MAALEIGAIFARRYRIVRLIATGGMGAVYEVVHLDTERRRALKVMHPHVLESADQRERFKREATIAASIESDHIVDVFDAGVDEATGMPFLVMELLRGEDLGQRLSRLGRLAKAEVIGHLRQAALALEKTHRARVIHRDLKPRNLFLADREDGPPRVKVLDFGIAKVVSEASSTVTQILGTLLYMAPEQLDRDAKLTAAVDIHALGMVAFTLLVGSHYYEDEHRELGVLALAAVIARGPRERASLRAAARGVALPEAFDAWFARATAVAPPDRFPAAIEAVGALAEALGDEAAIQPVPPAPVHRRRAPAPRRKRSRAPRVYAFAAGVVGLGLTGLLGWARGVTPLRPACPAADVTCGGQCVDTSADRNNCGACGHSCLGGACEAGACRPIVLASAQRRPIDVAVDEARVYWINGGLGPRDGAVMSIRKDGSVSATLASGLRRPIGMALDGSYVYWVSAGDGSVTRAPLRGGAPEVLATGQRGPHSIAVGALGIYWTNGDGGTVSFLGASGEAQTLAVGCDHPGDIALDAENVYWADRQGRRLMAASLRGGGQRTLADGPETPIGIAVHAGRVYWVEYDGGRVMSAPLRGGNPTVLADAQKHPLDIVVDASRVYWTNGDEGTVMAMALDGTNRQRLCSGQEWPGKLALDAESIYWTNEKGGQVMRLAK